MMLGKPSFFDLSLGMVQKCHPPFSLPPGAFFFLRGAGSPSKSTNPKISRMEIHRAPEFPFHRRPFAEVLRHPPAYSHLHGDEHHSSAAADRHQGAQLRPRDVGWNVDMGLEISGPTGWLVFKRPTQLFQGFNGPLRLLEVFGQVGTGMLRHGAARSEHCRHKVYGMA